VLGNTNLSRAQEQTTAGERGVGGAWQMGSRGGLVVACEPHSYCSQMATTGLFFVSIALPFPECNLNGTIQCAAFEGKLCSCKNVFGIHPVLHLSAVASFSTPE
jgi:hypothetical protein